MNREASRVLRRQALQQDGSRSAWSIVRAASPRRSAATPRPNGRTTSSGSPP